MKGRIHSERQFCFCPSSYNNIGLRLLTQSK
ncbi:hypothetical protein BIW11_02933 [Tropilaelaps mercedesae]|uniref:Uncharacterized protein n=1 Tax=Tropilaelaps mercedesae TaxID=418985 RepID=A0A1V9XV40_9ACAR|nr:hypothetical protein BIW11_02933 [Tropilaelaps mercedesae]